MPKKKPSRAAADVATIADGVRVPASDVAHIERDLWPLVVPIDSLTLDPRNARLHPDRNKRVIRGLLAQLGQQKPISVDAETNVIHAGNGTWTEAKALGWKYIARVRSSLKGGLVDVWKLGDNRSNELSEWDRIELEASAHRIADADLELPELNLADLVSDLDLSALNDNDFETAHAFAPKKEKPPREPKAKKGGKLILVAHFKDEKQQREWGDKLIEAGIDVEFRRG